MDLRIIPKKLSGIVRSIPSKSYLHRALICAAFADKRTVIHVDPFILSLDINATCECIASLGAKVTTDTNLYIVDPVGMPFEGSLLNCGESGSTLRFLLPVAATVSNNTLFAGRDSLMARNIAPTVNELQRHGATFSFDRLPFTVTKMTSGGTFNLPGDINSQFVTGFLLASPMIPGVTRINMIDRPRRAAYVDMTTTLMNEFGIKTQKTENGFIVDEQHYISPEIYFVEGDWSSSATFYAANALGCNIKVIGLNVRSLQGNKNIVPILREFPEVIDCVDVPHLVPLLATVAATKRRKTTIKSADRLKLQEGDRIIALCKMLDTLGAYVEDKGDSITVEGTGETLKGGVVDTYGDHRIAMAAAVAATVCEDEIILKDAGCVSKSYPTFWQDYRNLGGNTRMVENTL